MEGNMNDEEDVDLFQDLEKDYKNKEDESKTIAEKIIEETEKDFKSGFSNEEDILRDRQNEKDKINMDLKKLKGLLHKYKNVRNVRMIAVNRERAKKRNEIRQRIEFLNLRLREIYIEEEDPTSKKNELQK